MASSLILLVCLLERMVTILIWHEGSMSLAVLILWSELNSWTADISIWNVGYLPGLPGLLALQQQALSQQHHHAQLNGVAQDLSLPKDRKDSGKLPNGGANELLMEGVDCKKETSMMESVADVLRHAGSAFSLVRPKTEPGMKTRI